MPRLREGIASTYRQFLFFEIDQHLLQWRWTIPIPIALFIAYIVTGRILVLTANSSLVSNIWDVFFSVLGNGHILFFVLNVVLIYLVSDLPIETQFGELTMFRLRSRKQWWFSKISVLLVLVLYYLGINTIVVVMVAAFALPWQSGWSQGMLQMPTDFYLNAQATALSPLLAILLLLILLLLGWFGLGLATICASRYFNHATAGFLFGLLLDISGLIALKAGVPRPFEYLFVHIHLLFNLHSYSGFRSPYPPFTISVLYWVIWIVVFLVTGAKISLATDFFRNNETHGE